VTTPILRSQSFPSLVFSELLAINLTLSITQVDASLNNISLPLHELILSLLEPLCDSVTVCSQILELLDLKHDSDMQLVKFGHLLLLEVLDLLFSLGQFLIDCALLAFHTLLLILQIANVKLDAFFLII